MCIFIFALVYIVPIVLIICSIVFRYLLTLQQAGSIYSIFAIIPLIVQLFIINHGFRTEGNQCIIGLRNWFAHRGHKKITKWFDKDLYGHERHFKAGIIVVAIIFLITGLVMLFMATF